MPEEDANAENARYWDELCGSALARQLNVVDHSPASLKRYDDWYFAFYSYLLPFVKSERFSGQRVLEVGLGFGSLGQVLANSGADYTGLDIAAGPVAMMNTRLRQSGLPGRAVQGSILNPPFEAESFDAVVAIGSLHHTGDFRDAVRQVSRILSPGGTFVFMVYNAFSYRRWARWPVSTAQQLMLDLGVRRQRPTVTEDERRAYDADSAGTAPPETEFLSRRDIVRSLEAEFASIRIRAENIGAEGPLKHLSREKSLALFGSWLGLDLYVEAKRK